MVLPALVGLLGRGALGAVARPIAMGVGAIGAGAAALNSAEEKSPHPARGSLDALGLANPKPRERDTNSDSGPKTDFSKVYEQADQESIKSMVQVALKILSSIETTIKAQLSHQKGVSIEHRRLDREERYEGHEQARKLDREETFESGGGGGGGMGKLLLGLGLAATMFADKIRDTMEEWSNGFLGKIGKALGIDVSKAQEKVEEVGAAAGGAKAAVADTVSDAAASVKEAIGVGGGKASTGTGYRPASKIPRAAKGDKAFQARVTQSAKRFNISEDDLYSAMSFETGGTLKANQWNKGGAPAVGLIQFYKGQGAKTVGKTVQQLSKMNRVEQMDYVDKYLDRTGLDNIKNPTLEDLYMSIFMPAAMGKPGSHAVGRRGAKDFSGKVYRQNKGFDVNKDGKITKDEISASLRKHSRALGYKPGAPAPATPAATKAPAPPKKKPEPRPKVFQGDAEIQMQQDGAYMTRDGGKHWYKVTPEQLDKVAPKKPKKVAASAPANHTTIVSGKGSQAPVMHQASLTPPNPNAGWGKDYHTAFGTFA